MASTRAGSTMDLDSQSFGVRDSDREDTNQDMNQTIIGAGLSFTKSQTSPAKGDKAKPAAAQPSPAYLFRSPLTIVTIKVGPQAFQVHKELLTKNSRYFEAAFNGSFMESKDGKMTLEEVQPADFGFYVDIVYRAHFNPGISLRKEHTGGSLSTKQILTLWSLADRFLDEVVRAMAKESLDHRLGLYSVTLWKSLARKREKDDVSGRMSRLQDAYYQCLDHDIPFEDLIVEAASNCPPQVYVDCVGMMDPEFMALVSKRLVLRQAGEEVIPRKRRAAGTD